MDHKTTTSTTSNLVQEKDKTLLLRFPPIYVVVGAYRFASDPKIHRPIWSVDAVPNSSFVPRWQRCANACFIPISLGVVPV